MNSRFFFVTLNCVWVVFIVTHIKRMLWVFHINWRFFIKPPSHKRFEVETVFMRETEFYFSSWPFKYLITKQCKSKYSTLNFSLLGLDITLNGIYLYINLHFYNSTKYRNFRGSVTDQRVTKTSLHLFIL